MRNSVGTCTLESAFIPRFERPYMLYMATLLCRIGGAYLSVVLGETFALKIAACRMGIEGVQT